jgi:hypothetical protein
MWRWLALVLPIALCATAIDLLVTESHIVLIHGERAGITCIASPVDFYAQRAHLVQLATLFGWAGVLVAGALVAWLRGVQRIVAVVVLVVTLGCACIGTLNLGADDIAPLRPCGPHIP